MGYFTNKISFNYAVSISLILITTSLVNIILSDFYYYHSSRHGLKLKSALSGLIYLKVNKQYQIYFESFCKLFVLYFKILETKVRNLSAEFKTNAKNLLENDLNSIEFAFNEFPYFFVGLFQIPIAVVVIYFMADLTFLTCLAVIIVLFLTKMIFFKLRIAFK